MVDEDDPLKEPWPEVLPNWLAISLPKLVAPEAIFSPTFLDPEATSLPKLVNTL